MPGNQHLAALSLPAHGPQARDHVLHRAFGADLSKVWVTNVDDPYRDAAWKGGHFGTVAFADDDRHAHYYKGTTFIGDQSVDANALDGVVFLLDDIGQKLDKARFDLLAPVPSMLLETSPGCFQAQYVLDPVITAEEMKALRRSLLGGPWHELVKDARGKAQYMRLPSGVNVKPDKFGFKTRLISEGPDYTLQELMRGLGLTKLQSAPPPGNGAGLNGGGRKPERGTADEVRTWLHIIGKHKYFDARDPFVDMCHAIIGALGKTEEALDIWTGWCGQWVQGKPHEPQRVWDGIHDTHIGIEWLKKWAHELVPQAAASAVFEPVQANGHDPGSSASARSETKIELLAQDPLKGNVAIPGKAAPFAVSALQPPEIDKTILPGFDRDEVTIIAGRSGSFKSLYLLQVAEAVVENRPDMVGFGGVLDWRADALLCSNEDKDNHINRRRLAIHQEYKPVGGGVDWFHSWQDIYPFVNAGRGLIKLNNEFVDRLGELVVREQRVLGLLGIDTLTGSIWGGTDDSNQEYATLMDAAKKLARTMSVCVALIHHPRKGNGAEISDDDEDAALDAMRGGSALSNAARNVLYVARPGVEEAKLAGVNRRMTIKVWPSKVSHGPKWPVDWFDVSVHDVPSRDPRIAGPVTRTGTVLVKRASPHSAVMSTANRKIVYDAIKDAEARKMPMLDKSRSATTDPRGKGTLTGLPVDAVDAIIRSLLDNGYIERVPNPKGHTGWFVAKKPLDQENPF